MIASALYRHRWWVASGALIYAACLVATAPASSMAWIIARASGGIVVLERPEGSLWRGRAPRLLVDVAGRSRGLGESTWDVALLRVFRGELAIDLTIRGRVDGRGTFVLQPGAVWLRRSRFTLPASLAVAFFPAAHFIRPEGKVTVETDDILLDDGTVAGKAEALWSNASSTLSAVAPLGSYRARVQSTPGSAKVEITTTEGALQIDGRGAWSPAAGFSFEGTARATTAEAPRLKELLQLMGRDDGSGNHQLRYAVRP